MAVPVISCGYRIGMPEGLHVISMTLYCSFSFFSLAFMSTKFTVGRMYEQPLS